MASASNLGLGQLNRCVGPISQQWREHVRFQASAKRALSLLCRRGTQRRLECTLSAAGMWGSAPVQEHTCLQICFPFKSSSLLIIGVGIISTTWLSRRSVPTKLPVAKARMEVHMNHRGRSGQLQKLCAFRVFTVPERGGGGGGEAQKRMNMFVASVRAGTGTLSKQNSQNTVSAAYLQSGPGWPCSTRGLRTNTGVETWLQLPKARMVDIASHAHDVNQRAQP